MDKKYLAGLFDGAGSVYIQKTTSGFVRKVSVHARSKGLIENIQKEFNGSIRPTRAGWTLELTNRRDILPFLEAIRDDVQIVTEQVDLMIEVCGYPYATERNEVLKRIDEARVRLNELKGVVGADENVEVETVE